MASDHSNAEPNARELREHRLKALGDKRRSMRKQLKDTEREMRAIIVELLDGTAAGDGYRSKLQRLSGFSREIVRRIGLSRRQDNRTDEHEEDKGATSGTVRNVSGGLRSTHKRAA